MEQPGENAQTLLRERAFTLHEEAGGDVQEEFRMWHKLRPLLVRRDRFAGEHQYFGRTGPRNK